MRLVRHVLVVICLALLTLLSGGCEQLSSQLAGVPTESNEDVAILGDSPGGGPLYTGESANETVLASQVEFRLEKGAGGWYLDTGYLPAGAPIQVRVIANASPGETSLVQPGQMFVSYPTWVRPGQRFSAAVWFIGTKDAGSFLHCIGASVKALARIPGVWGGELPLDQLSPIPLDLALCVNTAESGDSFTPFVLNEPLEALTDDVVYPITIPLTVYKAVTLEGGVELGAAVTDTLGGSMGAYGYLYSQLSVYSPVSMIWRSIRAQSESARISVDVPSKASGSYTFNVRAKCDTVLRSAWTLKLGFTLAAEVGPVEVVSWTLPLLDIPIGTYARYLTRDRSYSQGDVSMACIANVDRSAPSVSNPSVAPSSGCSPLTAHLSVDASDMESGIGSVWARVTSGGLYWKVPLSRVGSTTAWVGTFDVAAKANVHKRAYYVDFYAEDLVGNSTKGSEGGAFTVTECTPCDADSAAPVLTISCGKPFSGSVSYSWSATDNCSSTSEIQYRYKLDGYDQDWSPWGAGKTKSYGGLQPGLYTFHVQARDKKGNVSEEKTCSFTVAACDNDVIAPILAVTCGTPSASGGISFSWTATDNCTSASEIKYHYKLEPGGSSWSTWSLGTSKSYSGLKPGSYTFHVQAKDKKGNLSEEKTCPFTVVDPCDADATPPTLTLTCGKPSGGAVSYSWSATDDCTLTSEIQYRYKLDGYDQDWSPWGAGKTRSYAGLQPGLYTFHVQARDKKGNVSEEKTCSFTIAACDNDVIAPILAVTCGTPSASGGISFSWTATDNCTSASEIKYHYKLEPGGSSWSAWSSGTSKSYSGLKPGSYAFSVQARDRKGNLSEEKTCSFTVVDPCDADATPPTLTLTCGKPSGGSVSYSWSATDNCSSTSEIQYRYKLDGYDQDWSPWGADKTKSYSGLPAGDYTFHVQARDKKGNVSEEKTCSFTIAACDADAIAPILTVTCGTPSASGGISFSWLATDNCTSASETKYHYKLEPGGSSWSAWSSGTSKSYSGLKPGSYTFYVQAKDKKGNLSEEKACPFAIGGPCEEIRFRGVVLESNEDQIGAQSWLVRLDELVGDPCSHVCSPVVVAICSGCAEHGHADYGLKPGDAVEVYGRHEFNPAADPCSEVDLVKEEHYIRRLVPQSCDADSLPPGQYFYPAIPSACGDLCFEWTATDNCSSTSEIQYQFKLEGYDTDWSAWASTTQKCYEGLPSGLWTMLLRAKDKRGNVSSQVAYTATVTHPVQEVDFFGHALRKETLFYDGPDCGGVEEWWVVKPTYTYSGPDLTSQAEVWVRITQGNNCIGGGSGGECVGQVDQRIEAGRDIVVLGLFDPCTGSVTICPSADYFILGVYYP